MLIIRAWLEPGSAKPLRADLSLTTDVALGRQRTLSVLDANAVGRAVREWLQQIETDNVPETEAR